MTNEHECSSEMGCGIPAAKTFSLKVSDLIDPEYIGDSIWVGFDQNHSLTLVKERSDGTTKSITMDGEVMRNFLQYVIDHDLITLSVEP